jgi:hypothetical protein
LSWLCVHVKHTSCQSSIFISNICTYIHTYNRFRHTSFDIYFTQMHTITYLLPMRVVCTFKNYKALKTLNPGKIRTHDHLFRWRRRWPPALKIHTATMYRNSSQRTFFTSKLDHLSDMILFIYLVHRPRIFKLCICNPESLYRLRLRNVRTLSSQQKR